MLIKVCAIIALSILSGVLYRMGGSSKFDTLYRDIGCPLTLVASLYILGLGVSWWASFLTFLLAFGAMTSYFKWASAWYRDDWRDNVYPPSWAFTGLMYGVCLLPCLWSGLPLNDFILRLVIVTILIPLFSELYDNVVYEEFSRGFIFTASMLVML